MFAVVALYCLPGGAWALPGPDRPPTAHWLDVELEGSNGYLIHLGVNPRQHLILRVAKEGFAAEYLTRDLAAGTNRVTAKLLGMGRVSLRFHPQGPVRHPSLPGCGKRRPVVQPGVVRGTIKFAGERHYTDLEVHKAEATTEKPASWLCRYGMKVEFNPREREWVSKFSASGEGASFLARKYRPGTIEGGRVIFFVEAGEAFEAASGDVSLTIWRTLKIPAPAAAFRDAHPEHLTVTPPPPFSGTGTLGRTPESVFTWEGALSIQFPGVNPVPLAGPSFGFDYCLRESGCLRQDVPYR
ncbi:MAG TPA: hypothetical protein VNM38_00075 [Solirubrobacterales bacterium]|nr:hypothetical protein [Solirubrobacterales bacterium]